jgi:hypothetical protein
VTAFGGNWYVEYNGYGTVTENAAHTLFTLSPKVAVRRRQTHAGLLLSTKTYADVSMTVRMKTNSQLRTGSPANPWEVAWLLWNYTDDNHFYSLNLKPNGWELGKEDPAFPGAQRYLTTKGTPTYPIGAWYAVNVSKVGPKMTVAVNGKVLGTYVDTQSPYLTAGHIGLYTEDANVTFNPVSIA